MINVYTLHTVVCIWIISQEKGWSTSTFENKQKIHNTSIYTDTQYTKEKKNDSFILMLFYGNEQIYDIDKNKSWTIKFFCMVAWWKCGMKMEILCMRLFLFNLESLCYEIISENLKLLYWGFVLFISLSVSLTLFYSASHCILFHPCLLCCALLVEVRVEMWVKNC